MPASSAGERVGIIPGFPEQVRGRLVFLTADNINTDAIYGKDYTYRDDMTPEMMAKAIMRKLRTRTGGEYESGRRLCWWF